MPAMDYLSMTMMMMINFEIWQDGLKRNMYVKRNFLKIYNNSNTYRIMKIYSYYPWKF